METLDSRNDLRRAIFQRQRSWNELLKKYYQIGFETGYGLGRKQAAKDMEERLGDAARESAPQTDASIAILEAERILREKL